MMRIALQDGHAHVRMPCCICNGNTEKHDVYAVAKEDDGTEGFVCESCIAAGVEGMKRHAVESAEAAIRWANDYAAWAREFQEKTISCPTMTDWEKAEEEWARQFLGNNDSIPCPTVEERDCDRIVF